MWEDPSKDAISSENEVPGQCSVSRGKPFQLAAAEYEQYATLADSSRDAVRSLNKKYF